MAIVLVELRVVWALTDCHFLYKTGEKKNKKEPDSLAGQSCSGFCIASVVKPQCSLAGQPIG